MAIKRWVSLHPAFTAGLAGVAWWLFVAASGYGVNPSGVNWDFTRTGQLGDSFGVFSSVMVTIAAIFAFRTYQSARKDSERLERQAFEQSFLNLVERRYEILDRVRHADVRIVGNEWPPKLESDTAEGQAGIDRMVARLRKTREDRPEEPLKTLYDGIVEQSFGLPNYFRFTYHIVAYAHGQAGDATELGTKENPAYAHVRLLRAQLSPGELVLIALNAVFGEGRPKFTKLIEDYALLHNMEEADIALFDLRNPDFFRAGAFGLPDEEEKTAADSARV